MHASGGIRTSNPSKQAAADPHISQRATPIRSQNHKIATHTWKCMSEGALYAKEMEVPSSVHKPPFPERPDESAAGTFASSTRPHYDPQYSSSLAAR
jgi:hypothetical protein